MKKVYVNEERCLGCHLCEFYCAYANSGEAEMFKAFRLGRNAVPRIKVEDGNGINFAVQCRHCDDPLCMKNCIAGAISKVDGVVKIDRSKCVGCFTCVLSCPYGCIAPDKDGHSATKCELCAANGGEPACVKNCINGAIVYEERGERA
ncbi:MAG: 4Fe-4S dicluster domain-containing protein [Ruminiclostridium sp.]|nr:4Fe-4S dicluster domain-containing protein [Ruminiclostridium sp.]